VLYGFASTEERNLFRGLIRVSGIGGKVALAILSSMSVADFVGAVEAEDALQLTRVPGIGRKTAERLIIELKDRLPQTQPAAGSDQNTLPEGGPLQTEITREAMQALQALGYKPAEASRLVRAVKDSYDSSEALIRAALQGAA
jgi:Holliday junction DNA helicase RuvA